MILQTAPTTNNRRQLGVDETEEGLIHFYIQALSCPRVADEILEILKD